MDSNCGLNKCLFNCFLTVIITIAAIGILDLVLYLGYAYFNVQKYYAKDLKRWRNKELSKYGDTPGWEEIAPPSESIKARQITGNNNNIWTVATDGNLYTCKKPCDGTDEDTLWRKYDGNLAQLSATNSGIWGVSRDNNTYSNTTGPWENKGSWTHQAGVGLANIAMGPKGWVWGVNQSGAVFRCTSQWQCSRDWQSLPITTVQSVIAGYRGKGRRRKAVWRSVSSVKPVKQVSVGNTWVWALTQDGSIYKGRANGNRISGQQWNIINVPEPIRLIAVGLFDNLYAVGRSNKLYKGINSTSRGGGGFSIQSGGRRRKKSKGNMSFGLALAAMTRAAQNKVQWIELKGSPKLQSLSVNTEMYGVDENGLIWTSELL
jgi:hypothetical protein